MSIFSQALNNPSYDNVEQSILLLFRLRWFAIIGQIIFSLIAHYLYSFIFPLVWLLAIVSFELIFQAVTAYRIFRGARFHQLELLLHLLIDVSFLTAIVFLTGGTNNPFTYLLLIPVALGNFMLKPKQLLLLTVVVCVLYSFLHINYVPLSIERGPEQELFNLHMVGMWINFEITAFILALFGLAARGVYLAQQSKIQLLREKQMKDEQLLSLGIMSANAAHELSTPLSTIAIIADDLQHSAQDLEIKEDIELMRSEIDRCKSIIDQLSQRSRDSRDQIIHSENLAQNEQTLHTQLSRLIDTWAVIRPEIQLQIELSETLSKVTDALAITVEQAISNLLNNAADASLENNSDEIQITASYDNHSIAIVIQDFGSGIPDSMLKQLGKQIADSTKPSGLGWGHFLSNASIERAGGNVTIQDNELGTLTRVIIPSPSN